MDYCGLASMAIEAREKAYAPYSGYMVGAALLCADGRVFTGCNVENASYPVCCCAERSALFAAVSGGAREFSAIAVAGGGKNETAPLSSYAMPCGMCRQALAEFGTDIKIISVRDANDYKAYSLNELLPGAFAL